VMLIRYARQIKESNMPARQRVAGGDVRRNQAFVPAWGKALSFLAGSRDHYMARGSRLLILVYGTSRVCHCCLLPLLLPLPRSKGLHTNVGSNHAGIVESVDGEERFQTCRCFQCFASDGNARISLDLNDAYRVKNLCDGQLAGCGTSVSVG
jgi:hypothetical protein